MFVLLRKKIIIYVVLFVTVITGVFCCFSLKKSSYGGVLASKYKIVIDAGHGGIDSGVCGISTGVKESDLNLKVAKKLEEYIVNAGYIAVLTRSNDAGLYGAASSSLKKRDMKKRKEIINKEKPNVVVSIHMNNFSLSTRRGAQVFYKEEDASGKLLAETLQNNFNSMEEAPRQSTALCGDYYILNCSKYASAIVECGFLSNPQDEALLITEKYQDKLAYTIFKGIVEYLCLIK